MANHEVKISQDLCIGCGLCERDCVAGFIKVKDGKATTGKIGCIECGHCEAICPKNAVTLEGFEDEIYEFETQTRLDPVQFLKATKERRTIRVFNDTPVSDQIIADIIEAGRMAPTGGNSQSTGYIVLKDKLSEAESLAVQMFRTATKPAMAFLKNFNIDDHFFFKKAPLVIVITGSAVNASLAAQSMAYMAESHGLGVLYSGFFTMCVNKRKKIRHLLNMEAKEKAVTTLVIGYPGVTYKRTVHRKPAKVRNC